jgi:predicted tellurium resistance membrane protein TerC
MSFEFLVPLLTLIALEVVLGIDNIVFISILSSRLPENQQAKARRIGILLAMVMRIGLLGVISWIMRLDKELFAVSRFSFSGKDLILIGGGLFLLYKSVKEIHHKMEGADESEGGKGKQASFGSIIGQILLLDLVFSVDSIITAVGLVKELWIMYVAVIITVVIMLLAASPISNFVNKHPAFKILALSFLMLIGFTLLVEGFDVQIPKGYIYFSMAFALLVDVIQMRSTKKSKPVKLHSHLEE